MQTLLVQASTVPRHNSPAARMAVAGPSLLLPTGIQGPSEKNIASVYMGRPRFLLLQGVIHYLV